MNEGWQSVPHSEATQLDSYVASIYDATQKREFNEEYKRTGGDAALLEENRRLKNEFAYTVEEE